MKNGTLTPSRFTAGSPYDAWWICDQCGHEWHTRIENRALRHSGCRKCYRERSRKRKELAPIIGERIKEARQNAEMSARELAEILGVHREQVNRWERGENSPRDDVLKRMADLLHVSMHSLLDEEQHNDSCSVE